MSLTDAPEPDLERLGGSIADLAAEFVEPGVPGWSRRLFSEPYRASREWVLARMRAAGLDAQIDPAGNVVGVLPGRNRDAAPLMTGSHTDTVHGGGRFDGVVGVLGAIEVASRLRESGVALSRDLVVVDFLGEEANPFGLSCVGSRAMAGLLEPAHLDTDDGAGMRLGDALAAFGLDPDAALRRAWRPRSLHGYVELHVEQGPTLQARGTQIGVVTAIAGIERLFARFTGRADHAGTMPMSMRHDALAAAAAAVVAIEREGCGAPVHGVSTVGRLESGPGASNVVPDEARLWAEMRSTESGWLGAARRRVVEEIGRQAADRGVDVVLEWLNDNDTVLAAPLVQDRIGRAADDLGLSWEAVPSGAGHDAAHLAHLGPMGMIFVPSVGGRSHCPEEFTALTDIAAGAHVLAATLMRMDASPRAEATS